MGTLLATASGLAAWGLLVLLFLGYHQHEYSDAASAVEWLQSLLALAI